jgi:hypothetical protein
MVPLVVPQLVANDGIRALRQAIADPHQFALEYEREAWRFDRR